MTAQILVINPNSDQSVTAAMDRTLDCLRFAGGPIIRCETLHEAPPGIETARRTPIRSVAPLCTRRLNPGAKCSGNRGSGLTSAPVGLPGRREQAYTNCLACLWVR